MPWYAYLVHVFAGAFLANGVPHFVKGIAGEKFQSPFANPPGRGLSSPLTNVLWGAGNLLVGYLLLQRYAATPRPYDDLAAIGLGALATGIALAIHFGRVNGNQ